MIQVKLIPNLLSQEGRITKDLPFDRDKPVSEYLKEAGIDAVGCRVIVSGKATANLNQRIDRDDEICVIPDVAFDPATWAVIVAIAKVVAAVATVISVGYSIYQAVTYKQPTTPNFNTDGDGLDESSPTYGWEGIQTTQDVGTPIPIVYGEHKVGGNIINAFISTDGDKNYLNALLGLCEGEIESISDIKINDQPIANFEGISHTEKLGTNLDTVIPNFEDLHDVHDVNQTLNNQNDSHVYTTSGLAVEAFEVRLKFPSGLFQQDSGTGAIQAWAVTYKIEHKLHTSGTWIEDAVVEVSAKQRTEILRYYSVTGLTAGQYDIRVTRTSATGDFYHTGDLTLQSIDEIRTDDLAYPNLAKCGIKALATSQLSGGMPNFSFVVKGKKILAPQVMYGGSEVDWEDYYWDPAAECYKRFSDDAICTWDGTTYVERYCANPVWCIKDLLTNTRYGLGDFIDSNYIVASEFLALSRYCDEKVSDGDSGYEKRFRMDVVIDSPSRALDVLMQLMGTFRGMFFYSEGVCKLKIDRAETPVQLFTMGNIIEGSFTQSWKSLREVFNMINVQFIDKDLDYEQESISVIDEAAIAAGDPLRKKDIKVFVTRLSQALREGKYSLLVSKYITRSISFKAGIDAIACQPGDVISVSHDVPQWGYSGTVQPGSDTGTVKLDREVTIEAGKTYKLMVQFSDDTIEEKTVSDPAGTYTELNVAVHFSQTPTPFSKYAFGESNKVKDDYRIVSIRRANDNEVEISAIDYNEDIYDTDTIVLPTNNVSALSSAIPSVTNLVLTERAVLLSDGKIENVIDVWFNKPDESPQVFINRYKGAKVYFSDDTGNSWILAGYTEGTHLTIVGNLKKGSTYNVVVTSVAHNDMESMLSSAPSANITIQGKQGAPCTVTNFNYSWGDLLQLVWSPVTDLDLAAYEIRDEDANWGTDDAHLIYSGLATKLVLNPSGRAPGTYYIRALNTSGIYSNVAGSITPTNSVPSVPTGLGADVFFNVARVYWTDTADSDMLYYEVYRSETNAWAGEEALVGKVSGKSIMLDGNKPRGGSVATATNNTLTDSGLVGLSDDYFNGDIIEITAGTGAGQQRSISDFDGDTGEVTISATWDTNPDSTSKYMVKDRCYIKIRGVDKYGEGSFTTALTVDFEALDENALGDNIVTARKIYVACLSAISANMGCVTAGVIQGGTIQTGSSGARTIFDSTGIYGYNGSSQKTFELKDGSIWASNIKLEDPGCNCNYSYLDSGVLKFHDKLGDVPYVKRICNGLATTGSTVCLLGWTTEPKVMLGIRELMSYNCGSATSCQKWILYYDTPVSYCNSPTDYGYCFTVHACLMTSGSTGSECIKDVNFGVVACTGATACSTVVRLRFQLWCNNDAPSNYYYGQICYAICYRANGSGTWCAYCFSYSQPHANTTELKTTQSECRTIAFPAGCIWEIMASQVNLSWVNSGLCASTTQCCVCTVLGTACRICHFAYGGNPMSNYSYTDSISFTGLPSSNVYCSIIYWTYGECACLWAKSTYCSSTVPQKVGWFCTQFTDPNGTTTAYVPMMQTCTCVVAMPTSQQSNASGSARGSVSFYSCLRGCWCSGNTNSDFWGQVGNYLCVFSVCQVVCYYVYAGSAACCNYQNLYSLTDTYTGSTVLDPSGCLSWLAIAYS